MDELEVKVLTNQRGDERVVILQRSDGSFVYRLQGRTNEWGELGPACGIYDSPEMAEAEARARVRWLAH